MEKHSYCKELIDKYKINDLNSKTLIYRIDGFFDACNMNLENSICEKEINSFRAPYINKTSNEEGLKYNVNFLYRYDYDKGNNYCIIGEYNDLSFAFVNYYDNDKNKNKINEIPFSIILDKSVDEIKYVIRMSSRINNQVEFNILKNNEKLHFYANIIDFSKVLNIIQSFVNNPGALFNEYNEIMDKKRVVFTNGDLNKCYVEDKKFEKPCSGFVKKIKMISNNH